MRMFDLKAQLQDAKLVGIAGHVRPDGDCVGSCLGLGLYLKKYFPQLKTRIYLEDFLIPFGF